MKHSSSNNNDQRVKEEADVRIIDQTRAQVQTN